MSAPRPDYAWRTADRIVRDFNLRQELVARPSENGTPDSAAASRTEARTRKLVRPISAAELLVMDVPTLGMLVEGLWQEEGCGYLVGDPKTFKTYTILEFAISITTGVPVFGRFAAHKTGPVLVFLEETKVGEAKERLEMMLRTKSLAAEQVKDLHLVIQNRLRLQDPEHQESIEKVCAAIKPVAVFFDPLARLNPGGEDRKEDIAPILDFLRGLQVTFHTAVFLTHHFGKPREDRGRSEGHRIRGSSDQYAWLDCALYFTKSPRTRDRVRIEVEHRESPGVDPFVIRRHESETDSGAAVRLEYIDLGSEEAETKFKVDAEKDTTLEAKIESVVQGTPGLTQRELLRRVGGNRKAVLEKLADLAKHGRIVPRDGERKDQRGITRKCKMYYPPGHIEQARDGGS